MYVATELAEIQKRFGKSLQRLESAYFVLRAMCEPDWLDVADEKAALKLHGHVKRMLAHLIPASFPTLIKSVLADDPSKASRARRTQELFAAIRKQELEDQGGELSFLAGRWDEIRVLFENEGVKSLPRPFREKMVEGQDEIRKVWVLWFELVSEEALGKLPPHMRQCIQDGLGIAAGSWETVTAFIRGPLIRAVWPNPARVRRKMNDVCRAFREAGRTNLGPTDDEIKDVAVGIVSTHEPCGSVRSDSLFADRLAHGDLVLSHVLRSSDLQAEVALAFEPVSVLDGCIRQILQELVEGGRLVRESRLGDIYYFTAGAIGLETPHWDEGARELRFRGKVIKKYSGNPARNQTLILTVFEELGWPCQIDDPLPKGAHPRRLRETITDLNKAIPGSGLRFRATGTGTNVGWETAEPGSDALVSKRRWRYRNRKRHAWTIRVREPQSRVLALSN